MKKLLAVLLCLGVLVGCGSGDTTSDPSKMSTSLKVEDGDVVKIDYVGKLDGVAFQGGTGNGYLLEIGSGTFIPGFEEQLIGIKSGDTKTITVTFPENYGSTDLAGKEVTFDVSINHLFREVK